MARSLMDEPTFHDNFNNHVNMRKTYLCYEVERLEGDLWIPLDERKGFLRNEGADVVLHRWQRRHAEPIFLERMVSWKLNKELRYRVTCFISWSPCADCANMLVAFLQNNKHVDLRIFASRIYDWHLDWKAGLRALRAAGAEVAMMTSKEFVHCWENFVDHQDKAFQPWDDLDVRSKELSRELEGILQNQEE